MLASTLRQFAVARGCPCGTLEVQRNRKEFLSNASTCEQPYVTCRYR